MIIAEFIAEIGLTAVKDKITDAAAEAQVKKRIADYLDRQQSLNYQVSNEAEIDLEGLAEYICSNMIEDVRQRLFGNKNERGAARKRIMGKAVSFATANTAISAKRTLKIVGDAVDILSKFYRSRINRDLLFVAGELEDTIKAEGELTRAHVTKEIGQLKQITSNQSFLSVDKALQQIHNGELPDVERTLGTVMDAISTTHELFPDFGFRLNADKKLISVPLNAEAKTRFPESYRIIATDVMLGDQPVHPSDQTIFDRAYRHQQLITFKVQNIQRYLGDYLDPAQSMLQEMIGKKAALQPPEFPPAFPCSVRIGEETVVPYLLMRTKEILDDGTCVITNEEQENFSFLVSISLLPNNDERTILHTISITANNPSNQDYLKYLILMKRAIEGECITLFALNQNKELFQGEFDQSEPHELDERIEVFQKIIAIEQFFDITIKVPESVSNTDYRTICLIYDLIHDGYTGEADKFEFSCDITDEFRENFLKLPDTDYIIAYARNRTFSLFNQEISIPLVRETDLVRIEKLSRQKEKIRVLDNGDNIKFTYIPCNGEKCKYTDRINTQGVSNNQLFYREKEPQTKN